MGFADTCRLRANEGEKEKKYGHHRYRLLLFGVRDFRYASWVVSKDLGNPRSRRGLWNWLKEGRLVGKGERGRKRKCPSSRRMGKPHRESLKNKFLSYMPTMNTVVRNPIWWIFIVLPLYLVVSSKMRRMEARIVYNLLCQVTAVHIYLS
ncbi:hypothetical protein F5Y17DRAFT_97002 [Xylariaceae sp. FL0594]|nr:hypothetical protein F5Y17DRAFT_97002 [Xylariaceae sp. FL0594]